MSSHANAEKDALIRVELAEYGDDGCLPRHTLFYIYGGDFTGLSITASEAGYQIRPTVNNDGVVIETTILVDEVSFKAHSVRMESWAEEFGCEYDGWECEVVTQ